jgi:hypothetical protein
MKRIPQAVARAGVWVAVVAVRKRPNDSRAQAGLIVALGALAAAYL